MFIDYLRYHWDMRKAVLQTYAVETNRLVFEVKVLDRLFTTSIWYKSVDFAVLKAQLGHLPLQKVIAHIAAFDMNKYGSLHLDEIDLGPLSHHVDMPLKKLWDDVFLHVWAQWRFENKLPHDKPPILKSHRSLKPVSLPEVNVNHKTITFFGGGKDSFVSTYLLHGAGLPYDVLEYSSSIYGNRAEQADIKPLASEVSNHAFINEIAVYDDFLDSPILEYGGKSYEVKTLAAAETPASIFQCIPIVLAKKYRALALGHEKSANYPNLLWKAEDGAPVNHQWGKSLEAQKDLSTYIKNHLVPNAHYYSTLMPLSDPAIFTLFATLPADLQTKAHSCNVSKPWCRRCAKCVYVWLFYLAYLDEDIVTTEIFDNEVLFDIPENEDLLKKLAGQGRHTPFECVGQPPESRLAVALCYAKGFRQPIVKELMKTIRTDELRQTLDEQFQIDESFLAQCELPMELENYYKGPVQDYLKKQKIKLLKALEAK